MTTNNSVLTPSQADAFIRLVTNNNTLTTKAEIRSLFQPSPSEAILTEVGTGIAVFGDLVVAVTTRSSYRPQFKAADRVFVRKLLIDMTTNGALASPQVNVYYRRGE